MSNPPFPYDCVIKHKGVADAFTGSESDTTLYTGKCDMEVNNFPTTKNGVLINKYKFYVDDLETDRQYSANDVLSMNGKDYTINDFMTGNMGTTLFCDLKGN